MSTKRKQRTVEQAFHDWWKKCGAHYYSESTEEVARGFAKAAWHNAYRLGQQREARKHTKRES